MSAIPIAAANARLHGLGRSAVLAVVAAARALENGSASEAEQHLASVFAEHPGHPEVLRLHAGIRSLQGRHDDAMREIGQAVAQRPLDALYQNTWGTILAHAGAYDDAISALRHCCQLQPDYAPAWYNLGVLLIRSVRYEEAAAALRKAVTLAPGHAAARAQLADMLRVGNHAGEAAAEYRRILAVDPHSGSAWWGLADLKTTRFRPDDIERMRTAVHAVSASVNDRIAIGFALAKALDDEHRYAESMAALEQANVLARTRRHWDTAAFAELMAAISVAFDPAPIPARGNLGRQAVFIVSLPRSGSTLIEQILASHPDVQGAGELPDLPLVIAEESRRRGQPFPQWVRAIQADDFERLGRRYLERTAHWTRDRPLFTDKLPNNWFYIGAIRAMLPSARIIVMRRDPLETCFSCYRQFLHGNDYTRTFADIAHFWREFDRSARDALARHAGAIHECVYERLVAEPEAQIRQLLDFCGLPFNPACLDFHKTDRDVRSPSAMQVRQPLRSDTAKAPRYGRLLDPLRLALGLPAIEI